MNQCDGCRRGLPIDGNGTHFNPDGSYDRIGCTASKYSDLPPAAPVTDENTAVAAARKEKD